MIFPRLFSLRSVFRAGMIAALLLTALPLPQASAQFLRSHRAAPAAAAGGMQMALGNPDHATSGASNTEHYLIKRPQYALSFNNGWRFPNWVSWHLGKADIGATERGQFKADSSLPANFTIVTPADYTRTGYDRGHNCPSKDRSANRTDNDAVFLMSNMTPQAHGMNAGPWEKLESYCRDLTGQNNELLITCGHGFSQPTHKSLGRGQVAVPDFGWKVVVVVPLGAGSVVSRIKPDTRVIAVRMPNINTISNKDWREYRVSVSDIEQATKLTFFDALPQNVAQALKNRIDFDMSAPSRQRSSAPRSAASASEATIPAKGGANDQVWVNTKSHAYWKPGTRYYGKTKQGKYMSEADAIKAGFHAAEESKP